MKLLDLEEKERNVGIFWAREEDEEAEEEKRCHIHTYIHMQCNAMHQDCIQSDNMHVCGPEIQRNWWLKSGGGNTIPSLRAICSRNERFVITWMYWLWMLDFLKSFHHWLNEIHPCTLKQNVDYGCPKLYGIWLFLMLWKSCNVYSCTWLFVYR